MNHHQIETIIRGYIPQIIHMSLATVKDNKPWVCEVHFVYDEKLNLYFMSSIESRHAQEIMNNPFVSGNIVTQHHKNQAVRCVDFEGTAELIKDVKKDNPGFKAYIERYEKDGSLLEEINKDGKIGLFKISVQDYYVFDSYQGQRGKYHLPWLSEEQS